MKVMRIATGQESEDLGPVDDGEDPAGKAMGNKGGVARAKSLTTEQRRDIARKGAANRWSKGEFQSDALPRLRPNGNGRRH